MCAAEGKALNNHSMWFSMNLSRSFSLTGEWPTFLYFCCCGGSCLCSRWVLLLLIFAFYQHNEIACMQSRFWTTGELQYNCDSCTAIHHAHVKTLSKAHSRVQTTMSRTKQFHWSSEERPCNLLRVVIIIIGWNSKPTSVSFCWNLLHSCEGLHLGDSAVTALLFTVAAAAAGGSAPAAAAAPMPTVALSLASAGAPTAPAAVAEVLLECPSGSWRHQLSVQATVTSNLGNKSLYLCLIGLHAKQHAMNGESELILGFSYIPCISCGYSACELGQTPWSYTTDIRLMSETVRHLHSYTMHK